LRASKWPRGIRGTGAGHSAWPNASYVINAWQIQCAAASSQQLRQLPHVRRNPPRLVFGKQLGGGLSPRLVLERPSLRPRGDIDLRGVALYIKADASDQRSSLHTWLTLRKSSAILRSWTTGTIAIAI